jgi:hypothetical protein
MEHLEFDKALLKHGLKISAALLAGSIAEYINPNLFKNSAITKTDFKLNVNKEKYSLNIDVTPENYENFINSIQTLVMAKASEIEELVDIYFQIHFDILSLAPPSKYISDDSKI